ncbi:MAG: aminotransferase class I/II-fold pyridoxal phosphate-dependent enzyme [Candidatus Delongbacteria bacterium]|nr:aminotransferase class I/II-fold pyridoxal phosphate-dependent enzyme [Candidatus Delongbacteria bacterium]MBN2834524.1 aminotransferase class I/II-fold pyridoxal phosphate-dependent enzyme [Candidatus Delongbacteria bacterium]
MKGFPERVKNVPTTIFTEIGRYAEKVGALKLSQGAPDENPPEWILKIAAGEYLEGTQQYAPLEGVGTFTKTLSDIYLNHYDMKVSPNNFTVTSGATEAILDSILAIVEKDDEVIVFEPFYDSYPVSVRWAGGKVVPYTLRFPEYKIDKTKLESLITSKTKCMIINNPHNPTGKVFTLEELVIIRDLCVKYDLYLISDEVYEYLVFNGIKHIPIASLEGMFERTVTISSTGKTLNATGWKIGWTMANSILTENIRTIHQFNTFSVSTPVQRALSKVLPKMKNFTDSLCGNLDRNEKYLRTEIEKLGFVTSPANSTYFFLADISQITDKNGYDFSYELMDKAKVALIPVSGFYTEHINNGSSLLRFNFGKKISTLEEAVHRLSRYIT